MKLLHKLNRFLPPPTPSPAPEGSAPAPQAPSLSASPPAATSQTDVAQPEAQRPHPPSSSFSHWFSTQLKKNPPRPAEPQADAGWQAFQRAEAAHGDTPLEALLPGTTHPSPHGPYWCARTAYPPSHRHGDATLASALTPDYRHLEMLTGDPRLQGFSPDKAIYLDLETTGLQHGAGTLAFLVGLAFFEDGQLITERYLLRGHAGERALLEGVWCRLNSRPYLVSFNGKSYDLTILQSRMILQRMHTEREIRLKLRPHLDLLHLSRALYKTELPDTRLQTLERALLGLHRHDDMPGSAAPLCWLSWIRGGSAGPLFEIARHNEDDLISMVTLAAHLARLTAPGRRDRPYPISLRLAELFLRRRHPALALQVLRPTRPQPDLEAERHRLKTLVTASRRAASPDLWLDSLHKLQSLSPSERHTRAINRARRLAAKHASL